MPSKDDKKVDWKGRLQKQYRLLILEEDTLREVKSFNLNLSSLYIIMSTIIVFGSLLIFILVAFTPLRTYIPGYGEVDNNPKFIRLTEDIETLEKAVLDQEVYIEGLMNMLSGVKIDPSIRSQNTLPSSSTPSASFSVPSDIESTVSDIYDMHFVKPLDGSVSAGFQYDIKHYGVDILGARDTPVVTIADGVVINANWTIDHGNVITLQHDTDVISVYKHNAKLLKNLGDRVEKGEAIAIIGNSGTLSNGPHLHFELWYKGVPLNPVDYLNFNK